MFIEKAFEPYNVTTAVIQLHEWIKFIGNNIINCLCLKLTAQHFDENSEPLYRLTLVAVFDMAAELCFQVNVVTTVERYTGSHCGFFSNNHLLCHFCIEVCSRYES